MDNVENMRDMIDVPDAIVRKIYKLARMVSHAGLRGIQMHAGAAGVAEDNIITREEFDALTGWLYPRPKEPKDER